jgi:hypothetical protein
MSFSCAWGQCRFHVQTAFYHFRGITKMIAHIRFSVQIAINSNSFYYFQFRFPFRFRFPFLFLFLFRYLSVFRSVSKFGINITLNNKLTGVPVVVLFRRSVNLAAADMGDRRTIPTAYSATHTNADAAQNQSLVLR